MSTGLPTIANSNESLSLSGTDRDIVVADMRIPHRIAISLTAMLFCRVSIAQPPKFVSAAVSEWRARVPAIQKRLEASDEENCRGAPAPEIVDAFGLRGDRLSVALVEYCSRGAYTDSLFPMLLDRGKPVLARFRGADGKEIQTEFLSGASVLHSRGVKLVAEKKAVFDEFSETDNQGKIATCGVKAYVWNPRTRTFDLDVRLSKEESAVYCRGIRAEFQ